MQHPVTERATRKRSTTWAGNWLQPTQSLVKPETSLHFRTILSSKEVPPEGVPLAHVIEEEELADFRAEEGTTQVTVEVDVEVEVVILDIRAQGNFLIMDSIHLTSGSNSLVTNKPT